MGNSLDQNICSPATEWRILDKVSYLRRSSTNLFTEMIICEQMPVFGEHNNLWNPETQTLEVKGEEERLGKVRKHYRELKSMLASGKLDKWLAAQPH